MTNEKKWKPRTFDPGSKEPFKISRSKIDLFVECPRCFYLDRKLGVGRPSMPAFTLNSAVDHLLKKEFDIHRAKKEAHPFMQEYGIDAVPLDDPRMGEWRENFKGVQVLHEPTNFLVFGAIDDLWANPKGEVHVVDYKSTSKDEAPTLEGRWQEGYKRQVEVYQWLLRGNGLTVSPVAYFVYVNGRRDRQAFDGRLEFNVQVLSYEGDDSWVPRTLQSIKDTLMRDAIPAAGKLCEYCPYREAAGTSIRAQYAPTKKEKPKETLF